MELTPPTDDGQTSSSFDSNLMSLLESTPDIKKNVDPVSTGFSGATDHESLTDSDMKNNLTFLLNDSIVKSTSSGDLSKLGGGFSSGFDSNTFGLFPGSFLDEGSEDSLFSSHSRAHADTASFSLSTLGGLSGNIGSTRQTSRLPLGSDALQGNTSAPHSSLYGLLDDDEDDQRGLGGGFGFNLELNDNKNGSKNYHDNLSIFGSSSINAFGSSTLKPATPPKRDISGPSAHQAFFDSGEDFISKARPASNQDLDALITHSSESEHRNNNNKQHAKAAGPPPGLGKSGPPAKGPPGLANAPNVNVPLPAGAKVSVTPPGLVNNAAPVAQGKPAPHQPQGTHTINSAAQQQQHKTGGGPHANGPHGGPSAQHPPHPAQHKNGPPAQALHNAGPPKIHQPPVHAPVLPIAPVLPVRVVPPGPGFVPPPLNAPAPGPVLIPPTAVKTTVPLVPGAMLVPTPRGPVANVNIVSTNVKQGLPPPLNPSQSNIAPSSAVPGLVVPKVENHNLHYRPNRAEQLARLQQAQKEKEEKEAAEKAEKEEREKRAAERAAQGLSPEPTPVPAAASAEKKEEVKPVSPSNITPATTKSPSLPTGLKPTAPQWIPGAFKSATPPAVAAAVAANPPPPVKITAPPAPRPFIPAGPRGPPMYNTGGTARQNNTFLGPPPAAHSVVPIAINQNNREVHSSTAYKRPIPQTASGLANSAFSSILKMQNHIQQQYSGRVYQVEFKISSRCFIANSYTPPNISLNEFVVCAVENGEDIGVVTEIITMKQYIERCYLNGIPLENEYDNNMSCVLRYASMIERGLLADKFRDEQYVVDFCRDLVLNMYEYPMIIVDAEYQFDRHKLTVYYDCDPRVEFMEFVKELFETFKAPIWMNKVDASVVAPHLEMPDFPIPVPGAVPPGILRAQAEAEALAAAAALEAATAKTLSVEAPEFIPPSFAGTAAAVPVAPGAVGEAGEYEYNPDGMDPSTAGYAGGDYTGEQVYYEEGEAVLGEDGLAVVPPTEYGEVAPAAPVVSPAAIAAASVTPKTSLSANAKPWGA